jgi:alanine racemase
MAHAANSAAILRDKKTHFDMVRPGIALYGIAPFEGYEKVVKLKPVLSWKTKIVFIKSVPANSPISYGRSFITKRTSKIALLPIGYADGYDRLFSNKASVLIRGQFCPVIGAVTMNMTMIDVTNLDEVKEADEVVLIGVQGSKQIKAEDLAKIKGTIAYEIVCQISKDLPRIII